LRRIGVLGITDLAPSYSGPCTQALTLAGGLSRLGVETQLVEFSVVNPSFAPCVRGATLEGWIERAVTYRRDFADYGKENWVDYYLRLFWEKRRSYQIVHLHGLPDHIYWFLPFFRLLGKKIIVKMTAPDVNTPAAVRRRKGGRAKWQCLRLIHRFVATSEVLARGYAEGGLPPERLVRIPNAVDTRRFLPALRQEKARLRQELGLPQDVVLVVYVGSLQYVKGVDRLIAVWERLAERRGGAELLLIGPLCPLCPKALLREPEYAVRLRRQVGLHKVGGRWLLLGREREGIRLLGAKERVEQYLRAADVFVFPSRSEGMPNAVLEAMACGLPVVAADIAPVREVLGEEAGFLVPGDDVAGFAERLGELMVCQKLRQRLGEAGRRRAAEFFSVERVSGMYLRLYEEVLG